VFVTPPLLIVEILSPEDRMSRMQRKVEDYVAMGCQNVSILDPARRKAYRYDGRATVDVQDTVVADEPELTISLSQIFKPERLT
jgi:Uma2 family endonuclease